MGVPIRIEPRFIIKPDRIHDQGIPFPVASGIAVPGQWEVSRMRRVEINSVQAMDFMEGMDFVKLSVRFEPAESRAKRVPLPKNAVRLANLSGIFRIPFR